MRRRWLLILFFLTGLSALISEISARGPTPRAPDNPAVMENLGGLELVPRHLVMESDQFRQFAGQGKLARDNDAFFLPVNAETPELIKIIQLAAIRANP
ncbi:MAG: hypothetical protein JW953_06220 [Anaerolineae bacterium]|nr:hypothetical protein [Anaerolineae bacterium]